MAAVEEDQDPDYPEYTDARDLYSVCAQGTRREDSLGPEEIAVLESGGGNDAEGGEEETRPSTALPKMNSAIQSGIRRRGSVTMAATAFKQAATKFNIKPSDGINFLVEKRLVEGTPKSVARYLHKRADGLSKRRLGEYLGNVKDFNQEVLTHFLAEYSFAETTLDDALRVLLRDFRLPGEAQQIDRILEKFSRRYFETNPQCGFSNADTVYILAFSLIMLNTDLHNPNIPEAKKMKLDGFLRNNKGIDDGKDVPEETLCIYYQRIKDDEIRMNEGDQWEGDVVTFMAPNKTGWLSKQNHGGMTRWKRHWFVLSEHVLYYFEAPGSERPRFILPMDDVRVGRGKDARVLNILGASDARIKCTKCLDNGKMELQNFKEFTIRAANPKEREEWYEALRDELEQDPVKKMQRLAEAKRKDEQRAFQNRVAQPAHNDGKDGHRLNDIHLVELPPPVAQGWMQKRGDKNTNWKKRYVALIDPPEELHLGVALYYFEAKQQMDRMLEIGEQTQKGQLFLEHVQKVSVTTDKSDKAAIIQLVCEGRNWTFRPEGAEGFTYWSSILEQYVKRAHDQAEQRAKEVAASLKGPNGGQLIAVVIRASSLGIMLANQPPEGVEVGDARGVFVSRMQADSEALHQGVETGDRLYYINNKELPPTFNHKHAAERIKSSGRPLQLIFERCRRQAQDTKTEPE
eukprot:CAMPEP_0118977248 /NCGR_PEP_ID=MMETSP1173-20130426/20888_1 /TAXON_ID=1034831 /ORGANISM="Rhizochromulina marina cf, Strain CCMP1243" /LENGTH=686 /DNA_ID=CAMNT_0006927331 /DNA_START=33 /DNA_END=2093 /DNA_ORIENTATION=+